MTGKTKKISVDDLSVQVQNMVASSSFSGVTINLNNLVVKSDNISFEPEQFPGAVYRSPTYRTATLIFSSGRIIITGARKKQDIENTLGEVVEIVKKAGVKVKEIPNYKVENIVASVSLNKKLNLDRIAMVIPSTEYEPEQFPGLVYRIVEPKMAILIFGSGKLVCTGAKSREDLHVALGKLIDNLYKNKLL